MVKRYQWNDAHGMYGSFGASENICTAESVVDAADYDALEAKVVPTPELNRPRHDTDLETIRGLGRRIHALEAALSGIQHCEKCVECANIAFDLLHQVAGSAPQRPGGDHG